MEKQGGQKEGGRKKEVFLSVPSMRADAMSRLFSYPPRYVLTYILSYSVDILAVSVAGLVFDNIGYRSDTGHWGQRAGNFKID